MKKLGFGMMRLPLTDPDDLKSIDQPEVNRMVDAFLEAGFNYFDTAYPYHQGTSEIAVGEALSKRHPRESFVLADKMPTFLVKAPADYPRIFEEQLERCKVSYFDCYLLHSLGAKTYEETLRYGGFPFVNRLKEEGRVRRVGFSFHDKPELLERILTEHPEMEFVQLQINYADWENESIAARRCYEVALRHHKPVIVMEPVKGGSLARVPEWAEPLFEARRPGKSAASWAIRYAASLDGAFMVLSGMSTMEQLMDNIDTMRSLEPLAMDEREIVAKIARFLEEGIAVPCTACEYCVDMCPQRIPIPRYFSLYNNQSQFRLVPSHLTYYNNLAVDHGKASDCIACGQCESNCPQHIRIIDCLRDVAHVFEGK
ncbi:MAG: aldo/keto reductase [Clostridiales bacterium]|nr:aldo/keto reductase [Clostridiales bacterium]